MNKTIKILKKDLKKFRSYMGNFNRILHKNGMKNLMYKQEPAEFEVRIHNLFKDGFGGLREDMFKEVSILCEGYNVTMDIPEQILKVNGCTYIGCMTNVDGIWQKHFVSEDCKFNDQICEENFRCDHCHAKIDSRTGYLFFINENDELVVTGRKCARSYFGFNVEEIVNCISNFDVYNEVGKEDDYSEESYGIRRGDCSISIETLIPIVAYYSQDFTRWVKKDCVMGEEIGTSNDVRNFVEAMNNPYAEIEWHRFENCFAKYGKNPEAVEKVKTYWANCDKTTDFAYNCKQIMEKGYISSRWVGYATWAIFEALMKREEKPAEDVVIGEFVGNINERMILSLIVTDTREVHEEGDYNCFGAWEEGDECYLKVYFDDKNGNHFQTNSHSAKMMDFFSKNIGKEIKIKGTVVRQFERKNGQKVNFITRCATIEDKKAKKQKEKHAEATFNPEVIEMAFAN